MAKPRTCPTCWYETRECICEDTTEQRWRDHERMIREEQDCNE